MYIKYLSKQTDESDYFDGVFFFIDHPDVDKSWKTIEESIETDYENLKYFKYIFSTPIDFSIKLTIYLTKWFYSQ